MNKLIKALNHLNCSELSHNEWLRIGMALKHEGFPCSAWDEWSSRDPARYHPGECARRWNTFHGTDHPVTGGTILQLAKAHGYTDDGLLEETDEIDTDWLPPGYGGEETKGDMALSPLTPAPCPLPKEPQPASSPTEQLALYLETLFAPSDHVSFVTGDVRLGRDGRWQPGRGVFSQTAATLLDSLRRNPGDLGATIGDWKPEAGAWIRFNALDGKGIKNDNVTSFRYALVESDAIPVEQQLALYQKLQLPIAALVHSGGKSLHAIVHVDAADRREYRQRVDTLYDLLNKNGLPVDVQNSNPSRLSRLPGVTRNGKEQTLLAVNTGRKSWADWLDFMEGLSTDLPDMTPVGEALKRLPPLPEELIEGVLRRGHKMLISGSSKAGKSFLLMELCIAIAEGKPWLGFPVKKGRVLYVNLEIDPASCLHRFSKIYAAMGIPPDHADDIIAWNLRGKAVPLDKLVPRLTRRAKDLRLDAVIIDPIYKVITGDENSASDMAAFCNEFDKICEQLGCATIYCHHHSKGAQGQKRAMDRASGSGVFARDPDAQLDMIELEMTEDMKNFVAESGATAWRMESSLREFENFRPINFWFEFPVHRLDDETLHTLPSQGSAEAGRLRNKKYRTPEEALDALRCAWESASGGSEDGTVTVEDLTKLTGLSDKTIYRRLKKTNGEFTLDKQVKGRVLRHEIPQDEEDINDC